MRRSLIILLCLPVLAYGQNPATAVKNQEQTATLRTIKRVTPDSTFYTMDYTADYCLDDFLKSGIDSPSKLGKVAAMKLMKPMKALKVFKSLDMGCSAFQTKNDKGDIIYARNFDYPHKKPALILLKTHPKNGYSSIGMATMAFLKGHSGSLDNGHSDISFAVAAPYITMDGINEKGFAVSVLALKSEDARQTDKGKRKIMTSVAIRMMLDKAATVDEAIELMKQYNFYSNCKYPEGRQFNYHFLLSDATGKSVVLEYIKVNDTWVMNLIDADHVTNFYLSEGWQSIGGGQDRYKKVEERKKETMSAGEAMEILKYVYADGSSASHSTTQWSVVYNLTKQTVQVAILGDYSNIYSFNCDDNR